LRSLYFSVNGKNIIFLDSNKTPRNGTFFAPDGKTIVRFKDGLIDGDVYDSEGKLRRVSPAIESYGHIEFWRQGKLHRDGDLPAISTNKFTVKEYWKNGIQYNPSMLNAGNTDE